MSRVNRIQEVGDAVVVPVPAAAADQPEARNQKKVLEGLLYFLLAMRVSGHTSGVTSTNNSISGPMLEAVYGGAGLLIFMFSMTYDCCTNRSERLGKKAVFEGHFSGIKLQFFISYVLSFVGSMIWMTETNKPIASQNNHLIVLAQILLGASGFITAKNGRDIVNKMRGYFRGNSADSEANSGGNTDPFAIVTNNRGRRSPTPDYRAQSPIADGREETVAADEVMRSPVREGAAFPDSDAREDDGSNVRNGLSAMGLRVTTAASHRANLVAQRVNSLAAQNAQTLASLPVSGSSRVPNLQGH